MSYFVYPPREPYETTNQYNARVDRERADWEARKRIDDIDERRRFDREMREAYGEEYPGQWDE